MSAKPTAWRSIPCSGGCGRTVRCHPAVRAVILCGECEKNNSSIRVRIRDKKRTEGKN